MLIKRSFPSKSDIFRSSKLSMQRKESATNYISRLSSITRVAPIQVEGNAGIVPTCPFEKRKVSPTLLSRNCTVASDSTTLALVEQMTPQQRHFLLHKVLQIMFFMEFFLLTEVLKTLIPAAYSECNQPTFYSVLCQFPPLTFCVRLLLGDPFPLAQPQILSAVRWSGRIWFLGSCRSHSDLRNAGDHIVRNIDLDASQDDLQFSRTTTWIRGFQQLG